MHSEFYTLLGAAGTVIVYFLCKWFTTDSKIKSQLAAYMAADVARMQLLNEALVKLAENSSEVAKSAEAIKALVATAAESSADAYDPQLTKYNAIVRGWIEQGLTEEQAAERAAASIMEDMHRSF